MVLRLPVREFKDLSIPMTVSVYDILRCKTRILDEGLLSTAISASCCVPIMFQPVFLDGFPYYDGGIFDKAGKYSYTICISKS